MLPLNILITQSIKKIKSQLSESYIFKYKNLINEKNIFLYFKI